VTQFSEKAGGSFSNYAFDFLVMSVKDEHECFDWDWIGSGESPEGRLRLLQRQQRAFRGTCIAHRRARYLPFGQGLPLRWPDAGVR